MTTKDLINVVGIGVLVLAAVVLIWDLFYRRITPLGLALLICGGFLQLVASIIE